MKEANREVEVEALERLRIHEEIRKTWSKLIPMRLKKKIRDCDIVGNFTGVIEWHST